MKTQYDARLPGWDRQRVRALRRHLGLTQREMAERLGSRQQTISEWELGLYRPRGASAKLLSIIAEQARFRYDAAPPGPEQTGQAGQPQNTPGPPAGGVSGEHQG